MLVRVHAYVSKRNDMGFDHWRDLLGALVDFRSRNPYQEVSISVLTIDEWPVLVAWSGLTTTQAIEEVRALMGKGHRNWTHPSLRR